MDDSVCNQHRSDMAESRMKPEIYSGQSRTSSSSSSTSSSQIDLDIQQDRRSNITILTDSSADNWTLRKDLKKGTNAINNKNYQNSTDKIEKIQNVPTHLETLAKDSLEATGLEYNIPASQVPKTTENKVINKLSQPKEIVKIRKASKFYGSGSNKQQVLCSLDLSIREGDM